MSQQLRVQRPGNPITAEEWETWLNSTPGFSVTNKIRGTNPRTGKPMNIPSRGAGLWTRSDGKDDAYFELYEGAISSFDPDDETVAKLREMATAFGAELTGG